MKHVYHVTVVFIRLYTIIVTEMFHTYSKLVENLICGLLTTL
jgi:hypothetical protein